ncbi:8-amino-7-oxononanoate synthase [Paenibacillus roseipurpureus]|uniref:8-amino-7-ketopelargonate synthase n=1 Tax=Paenibacillus roseopurpureus TaxID=2918901 RepID=A0AA96LS65_9BACL|nr:8-amino-7-oxononanoate synthase [Paenibacillus sp. MBLB1832]WNR44938.1 8-amino-7-oxononanoate synthase [Paenibacillus sp. MBLB1832]
MDWMEKELQDLHVGSAKRQLHRTTSLAQQPGYAIRGARTLLNLSSNDYLGLAQHPKIVEAMREALLSDGAGASASRLVTGNHQPYGELEAAIANWQNSEAALVFGSGYMANVGVISALVGRGDVVFSDGLNHASIVDGVILSRAEHARYRHNDLNHLRALLEKHRDKRRKLIVTDAIFSMDGDAARLSELVRLKREYGAMLMVDEAHGSGIYGRQGQGYCHALGLHDEVDVHMGTFSKAFGVYGAYVCGTHTLIEWLVNKARTLIYSTALPAAVVVGISSALELVRAEHWRRDHLLTHSKSFRSALRDAGFNVIPGDSPIVPVIVGDNETALQFSHALENEGILATAIRPPTVPAGTARIRFSLSAAHTEEQLTMSLGIIERLGRQMGVLA